MIEFTLVLTIIAIIPDHEPMITLREIDGYKSRETCEMQAQNLIAMHARKGLKVIINHQCIEKRAL